MNLNKFRRGNVPITILVMGVFLICVLALISFILAASKEREAYLGVDLIDKMNYQIEDYGFRGDLINADVKKLDSGDRVFYQEKIDKGFFPWEKDRVVFTVEYPIN